MPSDQPNDEGNTDEEPFCDLTPRLLASFNSLDDTSPQIVRVGTHEQPPEGLLHSTAYANQAFGALTEFVRAASTSLASNAVDDEFLTRAQKEVPAELIGVFNANPPATTRLLQSWTYVNQAPFSGRPNIREFLRGDRPNWALIAGREFFTRDIEDDLFNDMLDFATSTTVRPIVDILLGPAGFGITTLLLATAVRLVQERAGIVLYLRPGTRILEGDIEFAMSIDPEQRVFFFIDDAGDQRSDLEAALARLKGIRRAAMFVLGSRLNEWRQVSTLSVGKEFEIEELSDPEIERLIELLERHDELGLLKECN